MIYQNLLPILDPEKANGKTNHYRYADLSSQLRWREMNPRPWHLEVNNSNIKLNFFTHSYETNSKSIVTSLRTSGREKLEMFLKTDGSENNMEWIK